MATTSNLCTNSGYAWTSKQMLSLNRSQSSSGLSEVGGDDSGTLPGCLGTVAGGA